jgi:spore coat polysaccharide biosynthesis predicted glycosyltransferase SpsG
MESEISERKPLTLCILANTREEAYACFTDLKTVHSNLNFVAATADMERLPNKSFEALVMTCSNSTTEKVFAEVPIKVFFIQEEQIHKT